MKKRVKNLICEPTMGEEEVEVIYYGIQIIGSNILTFLIITLVGMSMGQCISALIYLSTLILLRRNLGGYHSKTYLGCLFITILSFLIIVFLGEILNRNLKEIFAIIFLIYSAIKIYIVKPVIHKNRVVNKDTIYKNIIKKDKWLTGFLILATLSYLLTELGLINGIDYFFSINASLMAVALSINSPIQLKSSEER
jgi:accessory gene regulator B